MGTDRRVRTLEQLQRLGRPQPGRHRDDDERDEPTARIPTPASRGSAPSSAATGSSPRSSCCGCSPRRPRRPEAYLPRLQADRDEPARTPSRARSSTRSGRGEMAALMEIPFGRYYGSHDATPLFVMLAGAHYRAPATSTSPAPAVAERRGARWHGSTGPPTRTATASSSTPASADRPGPAGLEGLRRLDLPRRRRPRRGPDRAVRDPGLRLRGPARRRRARRRARDCRGARRRAAAAGRGLRARSRRRSGTRSSDLRARARRRQAALPRPTSNPGHCL